MIELTNITKFYGHIPALYKLNLSVKEGALYGIVGPNGAGKTTAIKIITGLIAADSGTVTIDGLSIDNDPVAYKSKIGYVPDEFGRYNNLKVREYMEFFASCNGIAGMEMRKEVDKILKYVELDNKEDLYTEALSRGMKQKLSLGRALIGDPAILIMDEPTSGLDPASRYEFKEIVGELSDKGKTIIISSHILSDISELCTEVGIIDEGSLKMHGRLTDIMKNVTKENPIIITVASKITATIKLLRENPQVKSMSIKGNTLMIGFDGTALDETALLKELIEAGIPVRNFSREKGSLEAIFMQLTGNKEEKTLINYDTVTHN